MKTKNIFPVSIVSLALFATACSSTASDSTETQATVTAPETDQTETTSSVIPTVMVANAWARSNPNGMGAVYMNITTDTNDTLLSASVSPEIAKMVEIHEVITDAEGKMVMQEVAGIKLQANTEVVLAPGGYHIMLMGMDQMLEIGSEIEVTLVFEKAKEITITAVVHEGSNEMENGSSEMHENMHENMHGSKEAENEMHQSNENNQGN